MRSFLILFLALATGIAGFTVYSMPLPVTVTAANGCPSGYTLSQCYDYLIKKRNELQSQRKQIEGTLKNVQAQEGDIQSQINAINAEINANENELAQKQLDIEIASIEIANIGEDISETKNRIDTLKQEKQNSVQKVNEIAMMAYKVNTIPIWYLLAQNDLISTLEMLRYFDYISQQEKVRLAQFTNLQSQLASEEKVLGVAQSAIINKRDTMEAANLEIIKLKSTLTSQRSKQQTLLAELAKQEKTLAAERSRLIAQQNAADRDALSVAIQLFEANKLGNGTAVTRGTVIGREGYTGCTFGAHIHYGFISGTGSYYTNVNPFSSGLLRLSGSYVSDSRAKAPLPGMLMTWGFHDSYSIDAVSTSAGNQDSSRKYQIVTPVCWQTKGRTYSLNGWGAPVFAALDGKVYYGTDSMGGKYAIVDHGNVLNGKKLKSIYWHLDGPDARKKLL
jgi:peptidoglycan hydrolase CwlO-like protein